MGLGVVRPQLQGLAIALGRLGRPRKLHQRRTKIIQRLRAARRQPQGVPKLAHGDFKIALLIICQPQVATSVGEMGIDRQRFAERLNRFAQPAAPRLHHRVNGFLDSRLLSVKIIRVGATRPSPVQVPAPPAMGFFVSVAAGEPRAPDRRIVAGAESEEQ
jgi:hypothetical protein